MCLRVRVMSYIMFNYIAKQSCYKMLPYVFFTGKPLVPVIKAVAIVVILN